ncbi:hypothetical protein [Paraburkholderia sp. 40]|uniref:hypothetical protein n=1 Tax=Paraburkholderia sp. 40 TaxID=2991059 RepID=UPI003D1DAEF9
MESALRADATHTSRLQRWIRQLHERNGYHKTLIAIADKHARMLWVMVAKDFFASIAAPFASGWSRCRVALAPARKRRLSTAHTHFSRWHRVNERLHSS